MSLGVSIGFYTSKHQYTEKLDTVTRSYNQDITELKTQAIGLRAQNIVLKLDNILMNLNEATRAKYEIPPPPPPLENLDLKEIEFENPKYDPRLISLKSK